MLTHCRQECELGIGHEPLKHGSLAGLDSLRFSFQGPLQSLIERRFGLLVFRLRDLSLLAFHFELEELLFDPFHQHGHGSRLSAGCACGRRLGRLEVVFFLHSHWRRSPLPLHGACRGLLP
jgi:hypothetical protein